MMNSTALVLAGGGSRGSYQIGVWQALNDLNVKIDIVTGTSVGALNAALIAMGDIEAATTMWKNITTSSILDVELDEDLSSREKIKEMQRKFMKNAFHGGTGASPLKTLIDDVIDETIIRNSYIKFGLVVVDKATLKPIEIFADEIDDGMLCEYLIASASLYPAMKSWIIGDKQYIDGGYYDNLPVELALRGGATRVIAVDLESIGITRRKSMKKAADLTVIKSYWKLGTLLVFEKDVINRNIRLGYLDTMKAFNVFSGIAYTFIRNAIGEHCARHRDDIRLYNSTLNLTYEMNFLTVKENIFYIKMANYLKAKYGKPVGAKYTTFLTACMEIAGEMFQVDPEKIYSYDSFCENVSLKLDEMLSNCVVPTELVDIKSASSLLDKRMRTVFLARTIQHAVREKLKIESLYLALFMPDEFLAAYFIATL